MSHSVVTRTDIQGENKDSYLKIGWEERPAED